MAILNPQEAFYTQFEPIARNRFRVILDGVVQDFLVKAVTIPTPVSSEVVIDHINVQFKVKGKTTFPNDWSLTLYQAISPSTTQSVYEWIRLSHENYGRDSFSDIYKKNITVQILTPDLSVANQYTIVGAFIKTVSGLEFDKSGEGLVDITISGACDYCELEF
jgi:hypothetical protein